MTSTNHHNTLKSMFVTVLWKAKEKEDVEANERKKPKLAEGTPSVATRKYTFVAHK